MLRQSRTLWRYASTATTSATNTAPSIDFLATPFSETILKARIAQHIQDQDAPELHPESTLSALLACMSPQLVTGRRLDENEISAMQLDLLDQVLNNSSSDADGNNPASKSLTPDTLRQFLLSNITNSPQLSTTAAIKVLKAYTSIYEANGRRFVPLDVGMIPFRRAVYSAQLDEAFDILDLTGAAPGYLKYVKRLWWKYGQRWLLGTTGTLGAVHVLLKSGLVGIWPSTFGVLAMVSAYIGNMTILSGLAFAGRVSGSGEVLKWLPGTPTTYWYTHAQEMKMASLIAAVDRALPENQDECSFRIRKLLEQRKMVTIEFDQETLMKEYWARGGEGFEWVEPDQDPAEILWRRKMENSKAGRLAAAAAYGDKYKYADDLLPKTSFPHASLIDHPTAPELKDSDKGALPGN